MLRVFAFSLLTFLTSIVFGQTTVKLDEVQETLWAKQFVRIHNQSQTSEELIRNLPALTAYERTVFRILLEKSQPLPKVEYRHRELIFDSQIKLKIISLNDRTFSVDGKRFTYQSKKDLLINLIEFENVFSKKKVSRFDLFLPEAQAIPLNSELFTLFEPGVADVAQTVGTLGAIPKGAGKWWSVKNLLNPVNMVRASMASHAFLAVHEMVAQAESALAPSCDVQISELRNLMSQKNQSLAGFDCDGRIDHLAKADAVWDPQTKRLKNPSIKERLAEMKTTDERTISFWTEKNEKRTFNVDWINGLIWDEPDRAYFFDDQGLKEYRSLSSDPETGNQTLNRFKAGDPIFESRKKFIDFYRPVFDYVGKNRTCQKCQAEVQRALVVQKRPQTKSKTTPARTPDERKTQPAK